MSEDRVPAGNSSFLFEKKKFSKRKVDQGKHKRKSERKTKHRSKRKSCSKRESKRRSNKS